MTKWIRSNQSALNLLHTYLQRAYKEVKNSLKIRPEVTPRKVIIFKKGRPTLPMYIKRLQKHRDVIAYGMALAVLLFLLKWLELRFIIINHAFEIYIGAIAIIFTALGIWLAVKLMKPKTQTVVIEKEVYKNSSHPFTPNEKELSALGLSRRELEVLQLMAEGLSNQEIASRLFVSLNTIKTHSSKLFEKMEVKRRTQAVEKAQRSGLIP